MTAGDILHGQNLSLREGLPEPFAPFVDPVPKGLNAWVTAKMSRCRVYKHSLCPF
ncbi:hypothetical protein K439DRAFT_1627101 [Ramaria rubella]|nr:hypothetical protein K439DRAFT_1627101 [Ramaria rubella]